MARLGYLQLTRSCMQACRFCSNPPTGLDLDEEAMRAAIDDLAELGYDGVILTGGEPTLSPLLVPALQHASDRGLHSRIITNGQLLADRALFARCVEAGLVHAHFSLHSLRAEVHDFITRNEGSWDRLVEALDHVPELGITADLNTVICSWNARHLDATAAWAVRRFPFVRHFVWNNLDPEGNRAERNPESIPTLRAFEPALDRAMELLERSGRSFRAERVPLCAMPRFPHASTETRKIVKEGERSVHFLDARGFVRQRSFLHGKGEACDACRWDPICAGLYSMARHYDERELSPVFDACGPVVARVLGREPDPELLQRLEARRGVRSQTEQPDDEARQAARARPLLRAVRPAKSG
jgi:MoaA/NifB/PqqE/SkfB family radical SAM enzyme